MPSCRRFQFSGDDEAYIQFLERRVLELENNLRSPSQIEVSSQPARSTAADSAQTGKRGASSTKAGGGSANLQFVKFVLPQDRTPNDTQIRRQSALDALLEKIPTLSKLRSAEYDLPRRNHDVLKGLGIIDYRIHEVPESTQNVDIISILHRFSNLVSNIGSEKAFLAKMACFRELVFMSLCAVALTLELENGTARVYDIMRSFIGSEVQEKYLRKLLRGTTWAHELISTLSTKDWAPGCSYVLFLGSQPLILG